MNNPISKGLTFIDFHRKTLPLASSTG
uniref:Uncharacterized protein n=1 Tax=Rhizophora mucronata TaxID=61149 RepID=A0A2P2QTY9_RHIMU